MKSHLIDHSTGRKGRNILCACLNNCAHSIEHNGYNDQLHSPEHICNLGRGGLRSGSNNSSKNINRSKQTVLAIALRGIWLYRKMLNSYLIMS